MSKPMTQSERNALIKIVKGRFEVLAKHARQREDELRRVIYERVVDEHRQAVEQATRASERLREKAKRLQEEAEVIAERFEQKGVRPGQAKLEKTGHYNYTATGHRRGEWVEVLAIEETAEALFRFYVTTQWAPVDIARRVDRELALLKEEAGLGHVALATAEQNLIEEVLLGSLTSDEAQGFLAKVPSLDSLPTIADAQKRELTAGE